MSIYIKGMEMPKEGNWKTIRIYPDGTCAVPNWQGDCTFIKDAKAIPIPPHGDLIDRNDIKDRVSWCTTVNHALIECDRAPTIIPAEEDDT